MPTSPALSLFPELDRDLRTYRQGVLPHQDIVAMVERGQIYAEPAVQPDQLQPASADLRLGAVAHQVRASFLPGPKQRVEEVLPELSLDTLDLTEGAVLQTGAVYVVPLLECLALPQHLIAKANPKSTTGRLDVFTRLIADYAEQFDRVPKGYRGPLYVEVAPKTFSVRVRTGTRLNQMRFLRGVPAQRDTSHKAAREERALVFDENGEPIPASVHSGLWFSVDLKGPDGDGLIGWKARRHAPVIDVEKVDFYEPAEYWEPLYRNEQRQMILSTQEFYILGSKERVRVPPNYAAEMVPYDPSVGEFRVHYAGFFDPGFGFGEVQGTRAILEVRTHEIPYLLRDGQRIGRLIYERLLAEPDKLYGTGAGSSYQHQQSGLGKQFKRSLPLR
jgi:dCTP deaminase